jgi:hypothetical protein
VEGACPHAGAFRVPPRERLRSTPPWGSWALASQSLRIPRKVCASVARAHWDACLDEPLLDRCRAQCMMQEPDIPNQVLPTKPRNHPETLFLIHGSLNSCADAFIPSPYAKARFSPSHRAAVAIVASACKLFPGSHPHCHPIRVQRYARMV